MVVNLVNFVQSYPEVEAEVSLFMLVVVFCPQYIPLDYFVDPSYTHTGSVLGC